MLSRHRWAYARHDDQGTVICMDDTVEYIHGAVLQSNDIYIVVVLFYIPNTDSTVVHCIGIHGHGTVTYSIITASAVHNFHGAGRHFHGTVVDMTIIPMHIHGAQLETNGAVLCCHDNVLYIYKVSKDSSCIFAALCTLVRGRSAPFARPRAILTVP